MLAALGRTLTNRRERGVTEATMAKTMSEELDRISGRMPERFSEQRPTLLCSLFSNPFRNGPAGRSETCFCPWLCHG